MVCVYCGQKTEVINSRAQKKSNRVWRRRQCLGCKAVVTTIEGIDYSSAWRISGHNGKLTVFSRDKLLLSLYQCLKHRSKAILEAGELTDNIMASLAEVYRSDQSLSYLDIGVATSVALHRFDPIAGALYDALHQFNR